jgi:hypothetical protein
MRAGRAQGVEVIDFGARCVRCKDVVDTDGHKTSKVCAARPICQPWWCGCVTLLAQGVYHKRCFLCDGCGEGFGKGESVVERDVSNYPKVFHVKCAKEIFLYKCSKCASFIEGQMIEFEGNRMHTECFNCAKCGKSLVGVSFSKVQDAPHCKDCVKLNLEPKRIGGRFTFKK